jgi:hypothetical protein
VDLKGTVTNVTNGQSAQVSFRIATTDGVKFQATGAFDNVNLVGRFDVAGKVISREGEPVCLQFTGDIDVGIEGSGFPKGTKASFVLSLTLARQGADGVYHIGSLPAFGINHDQYGTMRLSLHKSN